jgi:hypothetical protein
LPWFRKARYLLGRVLCGRRPFAPYLDRERWESCRLNVPVDHYTGQGDYRDDAERTADAAATETAPRRADLPGRFGLHR